MKEISFRATKISPVTVKERCLNHHYRNKTVYFAKLSNTNCDRKTIKELQNLWNGETNFSAIICTHHLYHNNKNHSTYLITSQEGNLRKLNPEKIIGIAEVVKNRKSYQIKYLQTRPDCKNGKLHRPYKGVGDALMTQIISVTKKAKIYLEALERVVDYYKRLGFKVLKENTALPLMVLTKK